MGSARRRGLGVLVATAALALTTLGLSGCAPSAPSAPTRAPASTSGEPEEDNTCGAAVDLVRVLADGPDVGGNGPVTPEQLTSAFSDYRARVEPPLGTLEKNPPAVLKDDIGTLGRQTRFAIANKDPAPLNTDEFQSAAERLQSYVIRTCNYPVIRVTATNYAYAGIPPTVPAGTTLFTLINDGTEPHELDLYRIDDDNKLPMAELVKQPEAQRSTELDQVASISVNPASTDTAFTRLTPGRYGVACFEPQGSTPEKEGTGPLHALLGEVAEFTVPG